MVSSQPIGRTVFGDLRGLHGVVLPCDTHTANEAGVLPRVPAIEYDRLGSDLARFRAGCDRPRPGNHIGQRPVHRGRCGCDAVEPSALFVSAVLASPVPLLSRLSAAAIGTIVLMLLNLIRVVSLFLVRVYYPQAFDTMHLDVWQALFIFLAIVFWAMWASRVSRQRVVQANVAA